MGVVGDLGTGKTQLLKSLIHQIASAAPANRGIRPRILIFDYKRDYSSQDFVDATGARVVKPHRLPLNLFDTRTIGDSMAPWLDRFRFFADVLDKIYSGIGPVQRDKLKRAVKAAYDASSGRAATDDLRRPCGLLRARWTVSQIRRWPSSMISWTWRSSSPTQRRPCPSTSSSTASS